MLRLPLVDLRVDLRVEAFPAIFFVTAERFADALVEVDAPASLVPAPTVFAPLAVTAPVDVPPAFVASVEETRRTVARFTFFVAGTNPGEVASWKGVAVAAEDFALFFLFPLLDIAFPDALPPLAAA